MRIKFAALQCARVLHPSPEQLPSAKVKGQTARRTALFHRSLIERAAAFSGKLKLSTPIDWREPCGSEV